jgi:hypothetical protein
MQEQARKLREQQVALQASQLAMVMAGISQRSGQGPPTPTNVQEQANPAFALLPQLQQQQQQRAQQQQQHALQQLMSSMQQPTQHQHQQARQQQLASTLQQLAIQLVSPTQQHQTAMTVPQPQLPQFRPYLDQMEPRRQAPPAAAEMLKLMAAMTNFLPNN